MATADHTGIDAMVALDTDTLKCPCPACSALREVNRSFVLRGIEELHRESDPA